MAEPTETTLDTGSCVLSLINGADTYGYQTVVAWHGDEVTITRRCSGRDAPEVTTVRDTVTVNALLPLIVPGVAPVADCSLILIADDGTGKWRGFLDLWVRGGEVTINKGRRGERDGRPMPAIPTWFLHALRDLLLDEGEGED
jgi:hypothetical protein